MDRLKVAVIGVGDFGVRHAHTFGRHPLARLCAIVDADEARACEAANRFGGNWYTDVWSMLAAEPIDAVSIAAQHHQHAQLTLQCAQAGKHVFVEKPIATTLADADAMIEAARAAGVKLMVNSLLRFDSRYAAAHDAIRSGSLGEVITLSARRVAQLHRALNSASWNDVLLGIAIHEIDLMLWYTRAAVRHVYAEAETRFTAEYGREDAVFSLLRFRDGSMGCIENSWLMPSSSPRWIDSRMDVLGSAGSLHIGPNQGMEIMMSNRYEQPDVFDWPLIHGEVGGNLYRAITHFLCCVLDDLEPVPTAEDSRAALAVALALRQSCATGERVYLSDS